MSFHVKVMDLDRAQWLRSAVKDRSIVMLFLDIFLFGFCRKVLTKKSKPLLLYQSVLRYSGKKHIILI